MIKINLLGVAPPPTKAAAGPPATRAFQVVTFIGALIVSFAIVGVIYKIWTNQIAELDKRFNQEKIRQTELEVVRSQNAKYQQRLSDLETRINTIQALQSSRVGPVELMSALGNVVNRINDVYLYTANTGAGDRLELKGQSGTVNSMANFLAYLKNSGAFDDIRLEQFYQDDQFNRLAYKFTLNCQFKSPSAAAGGAAPPGPNAATPVSAPRAQPAGPHGALPPAPGTQRRTM
jgi:Tfp pilus assembly protein PilN